MPNRKWISLLGIFKERDNKIIFEGKEEEDMLKAGRYYSSVGNYLCNQNFSEGTIRASINFPEIPEEVCACKILLYHNSENGDFLTAGISLRKDVKAAFEVSRYTGQEWQFWGISGDKSTVVPNKNFELQVTVQGSKLELFIDGISVKKVSLPASYPEGPIGIWCQSSKPIEIQNFVVEETTPTAFVIMQFSPPYNDLFDNIIEPICRDYQIKAQRSDLMFGPGFIIADILQQIFLSKFVIAEITPANENVFFETGFAYGIRKPIIFLAEQGKTLPFDVSPFRVIFYENSIGGNKKIKETFKKQLEALLMHKPK